MTQERGKSPRRKPGGSTPKNCGEAFLGNNSAQRNLAADGVMRTDSPFPCLAPRTRTWKTLIKGQLGGSCMAGEDLTLPLVVPAGVPSHSHRRVSNLSDNGTLGTPCFGWPTPLNSFRNCFRWIAHDRLSVGNTASGTLKPARACPARGAKPHTIVFAATIGVNQKITRARERTSRNEPRRAALPRPRGVLWMGRA